MKDQALYDLLEMIPVQPGSYLMGFSEDPIKGVRGGQTKTTLTRSFELGRYPVTNLVWSLLMGQEPVLADYPLLPKVALKWLQSVEFCRRLNDELGLPQAMTQDTNGELILDLDSPGFRLPTEAEWEYAARAGVQDELYGPVDEIAWHQDNSDWTLHPVGLKLPNQWGFYDCLGGVKEWCWDWFSERRPSDEIDEVVDPTGPKTSRQTMFRTLRGGSTAWHHSNIGLSERSPGVTPPKGIMELDGMRLARTLPANPL